MVAGAVYGGEIRKVLNRKCAGMSGQEIGASGKAA
jgi:hypothetical protein